MIMGDAGNYIIYEDNDILVCHKPAGLAVQNARIGEMDLESFLKNYLAARSAGAKRQPYLAVVHRLDQPVEGLLVFGKTERAAKELSRQNAAGEMRKIYLAATFGTPPADQGILEDYLKKDGRTNTSSVVSPDVPGAKRARLEYKVLESVKSQEGTAVKYLLQIRLETGRHHQIRVQMAHAGMPLAGERKYGGGSGTLQGTSLGLCAASLSFGHPKTKKIMKFEIFPGGEAFLGFSINNFRGKKLKNEKFMKSMDGNRKKCIM